MARLADLRSRAVLRTAYELGIPHAHAVGLRELLYALAFQQADPTIGDARDVELSAGWDGQRGAFVAAARAAGMIVETEPGIFALPDFYEAAPAWVKKRADRAEKRKAAGRTLSDLRAEAGKRGAEARENKREANGSRLRPAREQTDSLPSLPPSLLHADQTEGLRPSSTAEASSAPATKRKPTKGAVAAYVAAWGARYGSAPNPTKEDVLAANRALEQFPAEEREAIVRAYVEDDDTWIAERAHRLGFLPMQLDRIRAKLAGTLRAGGSRRDRGYTGIRHPTSDTAFPPDAVGTKYKDTPTVRLGNDRSRRITPPSFHEGDPTPPGVMEIPASDDPEAPRLDAPPDLPEDLARLVATFPGSSGEDVAGEWATLGPEDRESALKAAGHLAQLWPLANAIERSRVPALRAWLVKRAFRKDEEDVEADIFGSRRFALAAEVGRPIAAGGGAG